MVSGDGWVSDDSSFYGGELEQERLEELGEEFNSTEHWAMHGKLVNTIAAKARARLPTRSIPPVKLHNPYEGKADSWQLGESITDFTNRLPPVTSRIGDVGPWIRVANPYPERQDKSGRIGEFKEAGEELLRKFRETKSRVEADNPGKVREIITRKLASDRESLKEQIKELARSTGVLSGKWMFFPSLEKLPRLWRLIAEGVTENRLGTAAKVATDDGSPDAATRLTCVYTKDFTDTDDVLRVLEELVKMGLVEEHSRGIYYKCDAYTWLDIYRDNEYGLPASIYSSKEMLDPSRKAQSKPQPQKKQATLDTFRRN